MTDKTFAWEVQAVADALRHVRHQLNFLINAGDEDIQAVEPEACTCIVLAAGLADNLDRIANHLRGCGG
jgi:hypothetical protein